jgi:UDP-glucose 4-epimerase
LDSDLGVEFGPERAVNNVSRRLADVGAAKRDLGWESTIGLEDGLRQLVEWWRPLRNEIAAGRAVAAS